jgi:hypothetical protein
MDYVNAEVKGQSGVHVDTQVLDNRSDKHRIVVHTNNRRRCSATLFLPEPLINLMLYSTRDATVK